ncbi:hypothetical protein V6M85_08660 [Sulfolobus tengchongensis]|uniref:RNA-binding protein n=1 Tax=Sulfolobus tengchongensis TaxID=207809 RepID=A0AAX4L048_9CREN
MKKEFIDKYIILTDKENQNDLSALVQVLKKYDVKAYNYKVEFIRNKINIRVMKGNAILNLANLSIDELENILKYSEDLYTSRFKIEFHNLPSRRDILDRLEITQLPYSEVHVFKDKVKIKTETGFIFEDDHTLEATYYLSLILDKINLKPFNIGRIRKVNNMHALLLLKYYGIRDLELIEKLIEKGCKVQDNKIIVGDVIVDERGIFKGEGKGSKRDLYDLVKVNK